MRKMTLAVCLGVAWILSASDAAQAIPADRTYEGNWYVSDQTDNSSGARGL